MGKYRTLQRSLQGDETKMRVDISLPCREEVLRKEGEPIPLVFREDQQIVE